MTNRHTTPMNRARSFQMRGTAAMLLPLVALTFGATAPDCSAAGLSTAFTNAAMRCAHKFGGLASANSATNRLLDLTGDDTWRQHLKDNLGDDDEAQLLGNASGQTWQIWYASRIGPAQINFCIFSSNENLLFCFDGTTTDIHKVFNADPDGANGNLLVGLLGIPALDVADFVGIAVHRGWAEASKGVLPVVADFIKNHGQGKNPAFFGYSLGGAVAGHTAYLLAVKNKLKGTVGHVQLITFGAPRWCTKALYSAFSRNWIAPVAIEIKEDDIPGIWQAKFDEYYGSLVAPIQGQQAFPCRWPNDGGKVYSIGIIDGADTQFAHSLENYLKLCSQKFRPVP